MKKSKKIKPIERQVGEYLFWCEKIRRMSDMTIVSKKSALRLFIQESGCDDLKNLDNQKLDRFIEAETKRKVSPGTLNLRLSHVIALVNYFREMNYSVPLKISLVPRLKNIPKRRVFYSESQINAVLKSASELEWLLIKIAFDTGMRISEIANLSVEKIYGRQIIFIGKGNKLREVYLTKESEERLEKYLKDRKIKSGPIWRNREGKAYSVNSIRIKMKKAFFRAGFDNFYPHSLRHSFGTDIERRGASVEVIKEMMGHSSVATTERYLHGFDGGLEKLFQKYR